MLNNRADAYALLRELGAPERLLLHVRLVGEAADQLMRAYMALGVRFNAQLIELGCALHDAGKIHHPKELDAPGSLHESEGEALLLAHHVQPEVARCCVTHAAWKDPAVSLEERSVALADKLWKGKRDEALELSVIDAVASRRSVDRWDVFAQLDSVFEEIAARGTERLNLSRN